MSVELRVQNQAQQIYTRALSAAWRKMQLHDPSLWLLRDPEAEEKMLRDPDILHAIGYRERLIAGRQWTLVPLRDSSPLGDLAVEVGTELLKGIKKFTESRLLLSSAFFSGQRFARIHHQPRKLKIGDGRERTWLVPTRLEDMDKRMYRKRTELDDETQTIVARWERYHIGQDEWLPESEMDAVQTIEHTYQDYQGTLGHGKALREGLGWVWYAKTHVWQEALQAVERFAQGIMTAKVDGARDGSTNLPNEEVIDAWSATLEAYRARHVLVHDKADEIATVQMDGQGWQLIESIEQTLTNKITTLVLGANLPTSASEGGSYALANVQENSTESIVLYDRESLEETLTDDLMGCVWHKNYANLVELGIAEEKPRVNITQEKRQDPKERAEVASTVSGMGVDLSLDDVLEQTGFRKPEKGEDIVPGKTAQPADLPNFGFQGEAR